MTSIWLPKSAEKAFREAIEETNRTGKPATIKLSKEDRGLLDDQIRMRKNELLR